MNVRTIINCLDRQGQWKLFLVFEENIHWLSRSSVVTYIDKGSYINLCFRDILGEFFFAIILLYSLFLCMCMYVMFSFEFCVLPSTTANIKYLTTWLYIFMMWLYVTEPRTSNICCFFQYEFRKQWMWFLFINHTSSRWDRFLFNRLFFSWEWRIFLFAQQEKQEIWFSRNTLSKQKDNNIEKQQTS